LVDELGGPSAGHRLLSLFAGESDVKVDETLGLPGGSRAASGLRPGAVERLFWWLHREAPDVVVAHGGDAYKYLALATGGPAIVYCVIGTWPTDAHRGGQRLLWRALVHRARTVAPVSSDVADDCRRVLGVAPQRLVVVPNGRDPGRFHPGGRTSRPGSEVALLFVGYLDEGKRPDRFVELVGSLRRRGLPVVGRILGDGPLRGSLEGPAATAGVHLLGRVADVVPNLQQADILVFPSAPDGEGMPGVLIEAGLCGLPVVATRVAGASTVVEHERTGILVPIDDFAALERATTTLVEHPDRRVAMGAAARQWCERQFSMSAVASRWDELLRRAHASRSPRHSSRTPLRSLWRPPNRTDSPVLGSPRSAPIRRR
jgi:glycosyltransferase involved in cell wall biosynthesis